MGTAWVSQRADFKPIYHSIFKRLNKKDYDWIYPFPQLNLISFKREGMDEDKPEHYDPAKIVTEEFKKKNKEQERKEFEEEIYHLNTETAEKAAQNEPPSIVLAYRKVYGKLPKGWPPAARL